MGLDQEDRKLEPLRLLVSLLAATETPYALIGGVAVQLLSEEPRTTLDIDVALPTFADVPTAALQAAGFEHEARHAHSDNWRAPGSGPRKHRIAVQFSAEDVGLAEAVARAAVWQIDGLPVHVATPADLVVLKLAAAEEPLRRMRKRRQDLLDVINITEDFSEVAASVAGLSARIKALKATLLG